MDTNADFSSIAGKRQNAIWYYALVFGVAWVVWVPLLLASYGWLSLNLPAWWFYLAGLAPIGAGVGLTWHEQGWAGIKQLTQRLFMVRFPLRWYALALALPFASSLITALVYAANGGELRTSLVAEWLPRYLSTLVVLTPLAIFEEAGWRGYLSPRLQHALGKWPSSILMGAIWAVWHFPFWLLPGNMLGGLPLVTTLIGLGAMVVGVTAFETQMTWLFNKTRGSLFFACFFHAAANAVFVANVLSPAAGGVATMAISAIVGWLLVAVLWAWDARRKNIITTTKAHRAQRKNEVATVVNV